MTIWGIADLHLSFAAPFRRERYAGRWKDHAEKIEEQWRTAVRGADVVLIPGDLSMARNHRDLQPDLNWLDRLPGRKVFAPGNHDGWFNEVEAVRPLLRASQQAVCGDAVSLDGLIVCGARGAAVPNEGSSPADHKAADAALADLEAALAQAQALRTSAEPIFVLWHYPPFDPHRRPGPWVERMEAAGVAACLYGHLHAMGQWTSAVQGVVNGIRYHCVAADAIGFRPLRIGTLD